MSDPMKNALPILARAAFFFYWLFDNLAVLIKIKFIQNWDLKAMSRRAAKFWLLGIWLTILIALMDLAKVAKEEAQLLIQKAKSKNSSTSVDDQQFRAEFAKLNAARKTQYQNVIKNLGDSITASQALGYPSRFLGVNFNDGLVGVGGFTSAFITCY